MNIQKYKAFLKVVEYGNITRAAEVLNYAQSGVSRMISDLEAEWRVTLCERSRSGITLTSDGLKLLPHIQRICNEYDLLMMQLDDLHEAQTGLLRIATFSSVATHWLPHIIKTFQCDYPNIEFELLLGDYTEIERWIVEGRVDFGFVRLPTKRAMETYALAQDDLVVAMPTDHALVTCETFPLAALDQSPFILLEKGAKAEIAEIFEQHKLTPQTVFTTWDDYAVMSMVEQGLGISILSSLVLQRTPYDIVTKKLAVPAYRTIGIGMREERSLSLAARKFLTYVEQSPFVKK
ncbi:MAG: LysR family transcriptional regulator [Caryophanon sp.]|nr:LysR family transcriptional regulator [Caryophanon sp.]